MNEEKIVFLPLEKLTDFKNHPFQVNEDLEMKLLMKSIQDNGIAEPLIVRQMEKEWYQIISGHRRKRAAGLLGIRRIPAIIRDLSDEEAIVLMVDANVLQRDRIKPSEKAFAYRMRHEALKKMRKKHEISGKKTIQLTAMETGESTKQVQRYISLTKLIPELLQKMDDGVLAFTPGVEISYLSEKEQMMFADAMEYTQNSPTLSQAKRIRKLSQAGNITYGRICGILEEEKKAVHKGILLQNEQLYEFFSREYSLDQIREEILKMLNQIYGRK